MSPWKRRHRLPLAVVGLAALVAPALTVPQAVAGTPAKAGATRPWDAYNLSPKTRTIRPVAIYNSNGSVTDPSAVLTGEQTRISGKGSYVTLDFGKEVGGLTTLHFAGSDGAQRVGLAFNESSDYVPDVVSDSSTGGPRSNDGILYADVNGKTTYTTPAKYLRGGFRYLTILLDSAGSVDLDGVSVYFTSAPTMEHPADYANYFYSSDSLLNRIWYAGAYTMQLNTIDPKTGRVWEAPAELWDNTGDVGVGDTILVDGGKRDRTVWPGDLGIEIPSAYAAFNDTVSARNALTTIYQHQKDTGELPYSGPMMNKYGSDTYHLWTLSASYDYYRYTGDSSWLASVWGNFKRGVDYSLAKVDANGLLSITGTGDSVRILTKGENFTANALLWRVLTTGSELATAQGDTALAASYASKAAALRTAINANFWDDSVGAYKYYPNQTIHPQDGNSLAVWYGLADADQAQRISAQLTGNWNDVGSTAPENKGNPGVFSGSIEVNAHFAAGGQAADQAGIDLIRREWGYMLTNPHGTQSTFWESYRAGETCLFCSRYTSLAHGWATGPTPALSFYVLGVAPDTPGGRTFHFIPHPADLTFTKGRVTTEYGPVDASWRIQNGAYHADLTAPKGTTGRAGVPTLGKKVQVFVNGHLAWNGTKGTAYGAHSDGEYVYLEGLTAHHYTIKTKPLGAK
ncbi:alpha-L-rhamnosidase C-terminal domain-containing protein [Actinoallomurus iriomotensis]|uniref:Alpha-L-rhamnosidase n=1 Tax=Actinoallomurus iriomotensis TaxID=478107 RepID=A0A9W6SFQ8_9ACTN|nr:alpha-L-rhamnosidase C-terminal domain-containing protein [Actinoallomurus iriomotensis]GLY92042.1 alpha-L-rhamnosidase [Actinoallomurus iriomotensis]